MNDVLKLRAGIWLRTGVRALGLLAVLLVVYNYAAPAISPRLPLWAPWQAPVAAALGWQEAGSSVAWGRMVADTVLATAGAFVTYYV